MADTRERVAPQVDAVIAQFRRNIDGQGYSAGLVEAGINRALGYAEYRVRPVVQHHNEALADVLGDELMKVEPWMRRIMSSIHDGNQDRHPRGGGEING